MCLCKVGTWFLTTGLGLATNGLYAESRVGAWVGPWQRLGDSPHRRADQAGPGMPSEGI